EQRNQRDDQPVKGLDDGGRDEAVPLKQIPKFKHRSFSPRQVEYQLCQNEKLLTAPGLAPKAVPGKLGANRERPLLAHRARAMRAARLRLPQITATIRPPSRQSPR